MQRSLTVAQKPNFLLLKHDLLQGAEMLETEKSKLRSEGWEKFPLTMSGKGIEIYLFSSNDPGSSQKTANRMMEENKATPTDTSPE